MAAHGQVDAAHDAEVEGHDPALRVDQHVAGVHVGVEEAVAEHLVEEDHRGLRQDGVGVVAVRDQPLPLVRRQSGHPLEGDHALSGAAPVDPRAP